MNTTILSPLIALARDYLQGGPFEPFAIVTSSGHRYDIPSADHLVFILAAVVS